MSLVFDEYGRPYIILREQENKSRLKGIDAQKANILAARLVSKVARSSLGPKGEWLVRWGNAFFESGDAGALTPPPPACARNM